MSTETSLIDSDLPRVPVFVLGATGYIGGSILVAIQQRYPEFQYTALVRNPKDNAALEALGVRVLQGSHSDLELVEKAVVQHDIVINCADADDLPLTIAVLKGMAERTKSGASFMRPTLIHTSGTSVVSEANPTGSFIPGFSEKIYDDNKVEDIRGLGPKQPHRNVDLQIFAAGEAGLIEPFIIAPSTIYGKGRGPCRNLSQQVNGLIRIGAQRKQVVQIGTGTNIWNNVHIEDLMELYGLVMDLAMSGNAPSDPYERFFFGSAREHVWGDIAQNLAKIMHAKGLVETADVKSIPLEEEKSLLATATNSRSVANRGFALGWEPSRPTLKETLPLEVEWTVEQMKDPAKAPNRTIPYGMEGK